MSTLDRETMEQTAAWLKSNQALVDTQEYLERAEIYYSIKDRIDKQPAPETKEELKSWLKSNQSLVDTEEYLNKAEAYYAMADSPDVSSVDAAARGALQGATFEFADEIIAGASAAASYLTDNPSGQTFSQLYDTRKAEEDALLSAYKEETGGSYLAGQVAGSVATIPFGGLFGKTGQLLFGVGGRGATAGQTAARTAAAGATQAGLAGVGAGEDLESRLIQGSLGVGLGGLIGGGLGAAGYKLAEKVANSSTGLINTAAKTGAKPRDTIELGQELIPQLTAIAGRAKAARDAAYTGWRNKLDARVDRFNSLVSKKGATAASQKIFKDETEEGAAQVIPTGALKSMVDGMQGLVENQKNINAILSEGDRVSIDTYRNMYKTAWDLQKQLAPNKAAPLAKKLKDIQGFEYKHLDSLFPGIGKARKELDESVRNYETGQLINDQLVTKVARGEALEPTFAQKFLPSNNSSYNEFSALQNRVNSWAKEAGLSQKTADEILAPLRANALSDVINNPRLLERVATRATSEDKVLLRHYKEMLTPEQFRFVESLSKLEKGSLPRRINSLLDYYSSSAALGLVGVGGATAGVAALTAGGAAGLAVLGLYLGSPLLIRTIANKPNLLAQANRIVTAPLDTPPKKLLGLTESLGKGAIKAQIILPTTAIRTIASLQEAKEATGE